MIINLSSPSLMSFSFGMNELIYWFSIEGVQIPLSRRAMDKSTPSLRSGGPFFISVLF
jgi:hypothetical protein